MDFQNQIVGAKYLVQTLIASGEFSTVYDGVELLTKRKVAVKISIDDIDLMDKEVRIHKLIDGTIGVAHFIWSGWIGSNYCIVMELLGENLEAVIYSGFKFNIENIRNIALRLLSVLDKLHHMGIVHNDLRPINVVLGKNVNDVFLIDFNSASNMHDDQKPCWFQNDLLYLGYVLLSCVTGEVMSKMSILPEDIKEDVVLVQQSATFSVDSILKYFEYCLNLKFDDIANFEMLKTFFLNK